MADEIPPKSGVEAQREFTLKNVKGRIPSGWQLRASEADQVVLLAADGTTIVSVRSAEADSTRKCLVVLPGRDWFERSRSARDK